MLVLKMMRMVSTQLNRIMMVSKLDNVETEVSKHDGSEADGTEAGGIETRFWASFRFNFNLLSSRGLKRATSPRARLPPPPPHHTTATALRALGASPLHASKPPFTVPRGSRRKYLARRKAFARSFENVKLGL
jgi:hypothetical protein